MKRMKKNHSIVFLTLIALFSTIAFAQDSNTPQTQLQPNDDIISERVPRTNRVRLMTFTLVDSRTIIGRVISEDKIQITVNYPHHGKLVTETFSRQQIIPETVGYRNSLAFNYWKETAEYFVSKTWDFENDPDEFISAIRCYENALEIAKKQRGPDHELVREIEAQIEDLQSQRNRWQAEAKKRAEMKSLEFEAGFEKKFETLTDIIEQQASSLAYVQRKLSEVLTSMEKLNIEWQNKAVQINDLADRVSRLREDVNRNARAVEDLWRDRRAVIYKSTGIGD